MKRGTRRGLAGGFVGQRLSRAAGDHPVGAALALCLLFLALGQAVLAGIVAVAVVLLAGWDPPRRRRPGRRWRP